MNILEIMQVPHYSRKFQKGGNLVKKFKGGGKEEPEQHPLMGGSTSMRHVDNESIGAHSKSKAGEPTTQMPAFYINFNRKIDAGDGERNWKQIGADMLNVTHSGFLYTLPDGTPVFKEYGVPTRDKDGNVVSWWGNKVNLEGAPRFQQGQNLQEYMRSIYPYLEKSSMKRPADIVPMPWANTQNIEQYIAGVDDSKYDYIPLCTGQTCGSVAAEAFLKGDDKNKQFSSATGVQTSDLNPSFFRDGSSYLRMLKKRYGYDSFKVVHPDEEKEEYYRNLSLQNSRNRTEAKYNFANVADKNPLMPTWLLQRNGHTCIYNGTNCVYPDHALSQNTTLVAEPEKHGWREIKQEEAKPGDAIILHNSKGRPVHFTTFDGVVPEGTEPYYYMDDANRVSNEKGLQPRMVQPGDTLVNYSPGTPRGTAWRSGAPLFRFDSQYNTGGDFEGPRRYFRATGQFTK